MSVPLDRSPHDRNGLLSVAPFVSNSGESTSEATFEFLSGGYDKTVRLWRVSRSYRSNGEPHFSSSVSSLVRGPLNSKINSLLHLPGKSQVLAAAGQRLWTLDVDQQCAVRFSCFSNFIYQMHAQRRENPSVFITEVRSNHKSRGSRLNIFIHVLKQLDHLLSQMHVFDIRSKHLGLGKPELEFGYAETAIDRRGSRSQKRRGDTSNLYFARGFHDGTVCMWDYRNTSVS